MKLLKQPSLVRLTFVESNAFSATQMSLLVMKRRKLCNVSNVGGTALFQNMDCNKFWNVIILNNNIHVKLEISDAMVREVVAGGSEEMAIDQIKLAMLTNKYIITYNPASGNIECMVVSNPNF